MKQIVLACALVLSVAFYGGLAAPTSAEPTSEIVNIRPETSAEPLVVLLETDPWASVVGSDSPTFALYSDGVAIYRKDDAYLSVRLDTDELQIFMSALELESLKGLAGFYSIGGLMMTDQPTTTLFIRGEGRYVRIQVDGSLARATSLPKGPSTANPGGVPPRVLEAYLKMAAFDPDAAVAWSPAAIEVMIWPYEYAPDESIVWPSRWPGLDDPETRQQERGYSLFVPASEGAALSAFLQGRRERGAVLIGGRKWAVSTRLPFPKEDRWMTAEAAR
jgi:hypothetical protein